MRLTKENFLSTRFKSEARGTATTQHSEAIRATKETRAVFNDAARDLSFQIKIQRGAALPSGQSKTDPSPSAPP